MLTEGDNPPPFIAITESWLKSYVTNAQINIDNYQVFRSDRPDRVGGGCLLYVHDQLVVTKTEHFEDKYNNMILCYVKSCNTLFAVVYRPPGQDTPGFKSVLDKIQESIDALSKNSTSPDIYISGDLNYPHIDWDMGTEQRTEAQVIQLVVRSFASLTSKMLRATGHARMVKAQGKDLQEFIDRNFLTQVVNTPTRENNVLDIVLTNVPRYVSEVRVTPTVLSDHHLVQLQLGFNLINPTQTSTRSVDPCSFRAVNIHKADHDAINDDLSEVDWVALWELCEDSLDEYLELLRLTVLQITLKHSPKKDSPEEVNTRNRKRNKNIYILKRKRRKINSRIRALQAQNPTSTTIHKLQEEVAILCHNIQEGILDKLNKKEKNGQYTRRTTVRRVYCRRTPSMLYGKTLSTSSRLQNIFRRQNQQYQSYEMSVEILLLTLASRLKCSRGSTKKYSQIQTRLISRRV